MLRMTDTSTTNAAVITCAVDTTCDNERELLLLLRRYVSSHRHDFTYKQFRRELVERFWSLSDIDPRVAHWYNQIEGGCSAHEHDIIDMSGLHCYFNGLLGQRPTTFPRVPPPAPR